MKITKTTYIRNKTTNVQKHTFKYIETQYDTGEDMNTKQITKAKQGITKAKQEVGQISNNIFAGMKDLNKKFSRGDASMLMHEFTRLSKKAQMLNYEINKSKRTSKEKTYLTGLLVNMLKSAETELTSLENKNKDAFEYLGGTNTAYANIKLAQYILEN